MMTYVRTCNVPHAGARARSYFPAVDVRQDENGYTLEAEVPGFTRDDIGVKVEDLLLTIHSVDPKSKEKGDQNDSRRRSFTRSFVLPKDVDIDGISASVAHGVLTLTLPKRPETKPRTIKVQAA